MYLASKQVVEVQAPRWTILSMPFASFSSKTNFLDKEACESLANSFNDLCLLLEGHAGYEDEQVHKLLRDKNSHIQETIEQEHHAQDETLSHLKSLLNKAKADNSNEQRVILDHEFYLAYRLFYSEMLKHLYDEETVILPELQKLYSDEELCALQAQTYAKMTAEQMLGMLELVFPYVNPEDRHSFISEMKQAEPEKFKYVWENISMQYALES